MAQASHKRTGRPECELFNEYGPLLRRTETSDDGTVKTLKGANCWACTKSTKKSSKIAWLYHIAGKDGDPGQGWAKCKMQDKFEERDQLEWRAELEELLVSNKKPTRSSPRRGSGASFSADRRLGEGTDLSMGSNNGSDNDSDQGHG